MLKNRTRLSSYIEKELSVKLKQLSEKTRIPMSRLLDEAIEDLIKKHNK
jgi:predicted DNA-binding protein